MKIRTGFVSNSSSSSFCILGISSESLESIINSKGLEIPEEFSLSDHGLMEDFIKLSPKSKVCIMRGIDNYYDEDCIGIPVYDIDESETIANIKKVVAEEISDIIEKSTGVDPELSSNDIDWMIDGGADC